MSLLSYILFLLIAYPIAYLPFSWLYRLSNIIAFILDRVLSYRKKVISANLFLAFPHLSFEEREQIRKDFYQNLADIVLESLKSLTISKEEIVRRYKMKDQEIINKYYDRNQSVIVVGAHFTNWEWGVLSGGLQIKHKAIGIYKSLSNKSIDKQLEGIRQKFGMNLYDLSETQKAFQENVKNNAAFLLLADQSPHQVDKAHWVKFLGIDTACIHGPEVYARRYKLPVLYVDIQRVSRGHYEFRPIELCVDPLQEKEGTISRKFMHLLENKILAEPSSWLWSHRRWKHRKSASA